MSKIIFLLVKFNRYEELTYGLTSWLNKANCRIHGTTKKIPKELFEKRGIK